MKETKIDEKKWRIKKRNGKLFKKRYYDDLTYEQYKIVKPTWDILGLWFFNKNKEKHRRKVMKYGLSEYAFWSEVK